MAAHNLDGPLFDLPPGTGVASFPFLYAGDPEVPDLWNLPAGNGLASRRLATVLRARE